MILEPGYTFVPRSELNPAFPNEPSATPESSRCSFNTLGVCTRGRVSGLARSLGFRRPAEGLCDSRQSLSMGDFASIL